MEKNTKTKIHPRMKRERQTIEYMIDIYCRNHHYTKGELCSDCRELLEYARFRLKNCPLPCVRLPAVDDA